MTAVSTPTFKHNSGSTSAVWASLPLYVTAVADTFGGAVHGVFPAALLVRAGLVALFLFWALEKSAIHDAFRWQITAALCYFCALFLLHFAVEGFNVGVVSLEAAATLRLVYAPLLACYVGACMASGQLTAEDTRRVVVAYGWLIPLSLLIGQVTGLGGAIGGRGTGIEAGKGFMIGANEVGLMLLLTCPVVVLDLYRRLRSLTATTLITLAVYGLAGVYTFTKSSLAAPLICLVALYSLSRSLGGWQFRIANVLMLAGLGAGTKLVVDNLDAILDFSQTTFFRTLLDDGFVQFLFRGRQDYIEAIYPQLANHDLSSLFLLFGAGEFHVRAISEAPLMLVRGEGTTFEMDLFDLVACYGMVGTCIYFQLLRRAMNGFPKLPLSAPVWTTLVAVIIHGFMAGHVVFSPQVMTLILLLVASPAAAAIRQLRPARTALIDAVQPHVRPNRDFQ